MWHNIKYFVIDLAAEYWGAFWSVLFIIVATVVLFIADRIIKWRDRGGWNGWSLRRQIRKIRKHLRLLGINVEHLSDKDLTGCFIKASRAMAGLGITAEQAANALNALGKAFGEIGMEEQYGNSKGAN